MYENYLRIPHAKLKVISLAISSFFLSTGIGYNEYRKLRNKVIAISKDIDAEEDEFIETLHYKGPYPEFSAFNYLFNNTGCRDGSWDGMRLRMLLRCLNSRDQEVRDRAAIAITSNKSFNQADLNKVQQASSEDFLLHLCGDISGNIDLFPKPLSLPPSNISPESELMRLFERLPAPDAEFKYYVDLIRKDKLTSLSHVDKTTSLGFETYPFSPQSFERTVERLINIYLLSALLHSSQNPLNCEYLLENDVLTMLRRIYESYNKDIDKKGHNKNESDNRTDHSSSHKDKEMINIQLSKILNNLIINSYNPLHHRNFIMTSGWLYYIALWIYRKDDMQSLYAQRIINNLKVKRQRINNINYFRDSKKTNSNNDRMNMNDNYDISINKDKSRSDVKLNDDTISKNTPVSEFVTEYDNRVFLIKASNDAINADVVFIHGLMGGPLRTWRQWKNTNNKDNDNNVNNNNKDSNKDKKDIENSSNYENINRFNSKKDSNDTTEKNNKTEIVTNSKNATKCVQTDIRTSPSLDDMANKTNEINDGDKYKSNKKSFENILTNKCNLYVTTDAVPLTNSKESTNCWPRDWLMEEVDGLRVLMVDYDNHLSYWSQKKHLEIKSLKEQSDLLLKSLIRSGLGCRPIIFVGHSMGGLLIKEMISRLNENDEKKHILNQVKGVVFYSVPHRGSYLVNYTKNASLLLNPTKQVLQLTDGSMYLKELHENFLGIINQSNKPPQQQEELDQKPPNSQQPISKQGIKLLSLTEGKSTNLPFKMKAMIVTEDSSDPGIGAFYIVKNKDHINICKPSHPQSQVYTLAKNFIKECLKTC